MKYLAIILAQFLAVSAFAQQWGGINFKPPAGGSGSLTPGSSLVGSCTDGVLYANASSVLQCSSGRFAHFDTGSGNGVFTLRRTMSGASFASNFLDVSGTLPTVNTQTAIGARFNITGAGSSAQGQAAVAVSQPAGFTGASNSWGILVNNFGSGTSATNPNIGIASEMLGAGGTINLGAWNNGAGTPTALAIGTLGTANGASPPQAGVFGYGGGSSSASNSAGLMGMVTDGAVNNFTTDLAAFISGKSAIMATNVTTSYDLVRLFDNTTLVNLIMDGGAQWTKVGTKTLVDATPTVFARVGVTSNGRQGGIAEYCVDANDATNYQTRCGSVSFAFVNEAGTEGCTGIGTAADADGTPTGTLTVAFTGATNAADTCDLLANAASSLTETTLRINYTIRLFGNAATAVTAQ